MTITPIGGSKYGDGDLKLPLDNPAILDALHKGNIQDVHKLLGDFGLTIADFEQFANNQHAKYMAVVQSEPLYESFASIPPPYIEEIVLQNPAFKMSQEESTIGREILVGTIENFMGGAQQFQQQADAGGAGMEMGMSKGMSPGKGGAKGAGAGKGSAPDLASTQSHIDNVQNIYEDLQDKIFGAQMDAELAKAESNFQKEWSEFLTKLRMGEIDPEAAICAIAMLQSQRIGAQSTREMKKIYQANQHSSRALEDMQKMDPTSPKYSASLMQVGNVQKIDNQNIQLATNNVNSCSNAAQTYLNACKSMLDSYSAMKMKFAEATGVR